MTQPTTNRLYALASEIEGYAQRRPLIHLIMGGWENADDTLAGKNPSEEEYEDCAMRSLEFLLCYEPDATVRAWFEAQGVRY
jgi:hypothetical protein